MTEILVQVVPQPGASGDLSGPYFENLSKRIDDIAAGIAEIARHLKERLDREDLPSGDERWNLQEVSIGMSLDLKAEAGVIVTRASTNAGFRVEIKWQHGK